MVDSARDRIIYNMTRERHDSIRIEMNHRELIENKKLYRKIRSENLSLSHRNAIELVKMINSDSDSLTAEDFK